MILNCILDPLWFNADIALRSNGAAVLKKSILACSFRGDLGTNDPTEESALELLKRIL
jgi:type I restriction enzyme S subunit